MSNTRHDNDQDLNNIRPGNIDDLFENDDSLDVNIIPDESEEKEKDSSKEYYLTGMKLLLQSGETNDNYKQILTEYENALVIRKDRIDNIFFNLLGLFQNVRDELDSSEIISDINNLRGLEIAKDPDFIFKSV